MAKIRRTLELSKIEIKKIKIKKIKIKKIKIKKIKIKKIKIKKLNYIIIIKISKIFINGEIIIKIIEFSRIRNLRKIKNKK
jgi:hypothetical protein